MKKYLAGLAISTLLFLLACDENDNFVIFSIANDVELGQQVHNEILSNPEYVILSPNQHQAAYNYLYSIRDAILSSGEIAYKDEFEWNVFILKDDAVQNAFAIPGGNIYIYTGLIKYLDHADDLAGVMGHEMAHADLRHTVRNLQKVYGVNILLSIALGQDASQLEQIVAQIAGTLAGLSFTREYEEEADAHSVEYLAHTQYACNGAGHFFEKMNAEGNGSPPEFLSTHPNPENRIEAINSKAESLGCDTALSGESQFDAIKTSL